jgi:hypothetical protein
VLIYKESVEILFAVLFPLPLRVQRLSECNPWDELDAVLLKELLQEYIELRMESEAKKLEKSAAFHFANGRKLWHCLDLSYLQEVGK